MQNCANVSNIFGTDWVPMSKLIYIFADGTLNDYFLAANFILGPTGKDGLAQIKIRFRTTNPPLNIKQGTGLYVNPKVWAVRNDPKKLNQYKDFPEVLATVNLAKEILTALEDMYTNKEEINNDIIAKRIRDITTAEEKKRLEEEEKEKRRLEEEANRVTLNKYIKMFYDGAEDGSRLTVNGLKYKRGTVNSIGQAKDRFIAFQEEKGRTYDFNDIDMDFYHDFTAFMNNKKLALNTVGKTINWFKTILATAETEGYNTNTIFRDKRFKGARAEVDAIYLTQEDLDKIRKVDMSKFHAGYDKARDIFMVGVWTAQRVSDYNYLKKENIKTVTRQVIENKPIKKGSQKTKPVVVEKKITVIDLTQRKTGTKVVIPCSSELLKILKKYDFNLPHIADQNINDYMKEIAKAAGLTEMVRIEKVLGGEKKVEWHPKHELVHTHTARRTGATLMYLSGMEVYDIMKITGHSTPNMLKKYIKADELETVNTIVQKYDYFK